MLNSSKALQSKLYNDLGVQALVGTVTGGYYAVFSSNPMPDLADNVYPSINHYRSGFQPVYQEWTDMTYTVNCWARTELEAMELQETVAVLLTESYENGFRFLANILPVLPVAEDGGVYNAPVEVRVQKNNRIKE